MRFHNIIRIAEEPRRADQSAVCAINRHLLYGLRTLSSGGWMILFICIIGGVRDKSAPTADLFSWCLIHAVPMRT